MNIYALHSSSSEFSSLAEDVSSIIQVEIFEDQEALLLSLHNCAGILLDLDSEPKKIEKTIRNIRKTDKDLPIIVLCNSLEGKKLQKHQASKSAADIYFSTPTDVEIMRMMMEEVFSSNASEDTRTVALEILKDHSEKSLSSKAQLVSERLDSVFSSTFFSEYNVRKAEEMKKKESESPVVEEIQDIELDGTMGGLDLNLDAELSLGDASSDDSMELNLDDDAEIQLGEESADLEIGDEELEDLAFGNDSSLDLGGLEQESNIDLSLGDEEVEAETVEEDDGGLDLGGLDLSGLDLGDSDDELSLGDDEPDVEAQESEGLELSLDGDVSEEDGLEISLGDDDPADDEGGLSLGDDSDEGGLSLGDDSDEGGISLMDDDTSESQMFDLGKEDSDAEDVSLNLGSMDEEISLGEDDSDDLAMGMEEEFSLSDEDDELKQTEDLDEYDVTRPILQSELEQIMTSEDEDPEDLDAKTIVGVVAASNDDGEEFTISGDDLGEEFSLDSSSDDEDASNPLSDIQTKMLEIDAMLKGEDLSSVNEKTEDVPDFNLGEDEPLSEMEVSFEDNVTEEPVKPVVKKEKPVQQETIREPIHTVSKATLEEHKEYQKNHDVELVRLGETIKGLREDREKLIGKVSHLEDKFDSDKSDFIDLKAELDEKKIEIAIVKKRFSSQVEDLNLKLDLLLNKKEVLQEQNKMYESEFEKLRKEKKLDINKVRSRERELEEKLDLLKNDAEVQVRNRDHKILDLKRRIDTLEFDVESSQIKERKIVTNQQAIEDKMNNVIKTLRSAIGHLEDESSLDERKRLIKKNLDV
jgi:hypothetical protein